MSHSTLMYTSCWFLVVHAYAKYVILLCLWDSRDLLSCRSLQVLLDPLDTIMSLSRSQSLALPAKTHVTPISSSRFEIVFTPRLGNITNQPLSYLRYKIFPAKTTQTKATTAPKVATHYNQLI